ncbi:MAG: efflux RND transporter periplasmic adaptor subunit [Kangiellaceae bacterium]|nr:efflux RND transporter periplasmic adaptor subunit [Kangiellaceae bacterium]
MKKTVLIVLILLVVIGIPVSKRFLEKDSVKEVVTETLSTQKIEASILASGQLKHEQEVKLSAEVIGKVTRLFVIEGDRVEKGQLVLQIDDESYIAAVEQQAAVVSQQEVAIERQQLVVANLKHQWLRKKSLFNRKLLDKDAFEAMTHSYEVATVDLRSAHEILKQVVARLEQSKDQLSKTKVRSPIDGNITSLDIKEGETAISGTTNIVGSSLMTIANPESMLAEINVDEADIADVKIGQRAEIISIAFANHPIVGHVESIASSAKNTPGRQSLSFAVKLRLQDRDGVSLRPGMSCRAEVFTQGEQNKLAVPIRALRTEEDNDQDIVKNYVFRVNGESVERVDIKVGISDDEYQEVVEGLVKGDVIVIGPDKIIRHLKDGETVAIDKTTNKSKSTPTSTAKMGG